MAAAAGVAQVMEKVSMREGHAALVLLLLPAIGERATTGVVMLAVMELLLELLLLLLLLLLDAVVGRHTQRRSEAVGGLGAMGSMTGESTTRLPPAREPKVGKSLVGSAAAAAAAGGASKLTSVSTLLGSGELRMAPPNHSTVSLATMGAAAVAAEAVAGSMGEGQARVKAEALLEAR